MMDFENFDTLIKTYIVVQVIRHLNNLRGEGEHNTDEGLS